MDDIYEEFEEQYCSCCEACGMCCGATVDEMVTCHMWPVFLVENGII